MKSIIGHTRHQITADDIEQVSQALRGSYLTQGPWVEKFETELSGICGQSHCLATSSGTTALHLACAAFGVDAQTDIFVPVITFVASLNVGLYFNANPVFIDVHPQTGNIDLNALESALKKSAARKKVIVPVHFAGLPCDLDEIASLARRYRAHVIEDAAHALGAKYKSKSIGFVYPDHLTAFSFHPAKHITTGEGGAVSCGKAGAHSILKLLRSHGIEKEHLIQKDQKAPWYYEAQFLGYNHRMSDINAALGWSQLQRFKENLKRRRALVRIYNEALGNLKHVKLPQSMPDREHAWLLYLLHIDYKAQGLSREELMLALKEKGVGTQVHNIPIYRFPLYQKFRVQNSDFPGAESFYKSALSIPLFPQMSQEDQDQVINALHDILN